MCASVVGGRVPGYKRAWKRKGRCVSGRGEHEFSVTVKTVATLVLVKTVHCRPASAMLILSLAKSSKL